MGTIRKGRNYMTLFSNIVTGQMIHVVEGRSEEVTRGFLKLLKQKDCNRSRGRNPSPSPRACPSSNFYPLNGYKRLRGIAIGMNAVHASAIQLHPPYVRLCLGKFRLP